jgi:hypothetical protein
MTDAVAALLLARALRDAAPRIAVEPRPHPALRVGGIGHRAIAGDKIGPIKTTLHNVFAIIRETANAALAQEATGKWFAGALDCAVITPLAEGADRLIARAGTGQGWRLGAVLPFPQADYERTFDLDPSNRAPAIADFRALLKDAVLPDGHGVLVLDGKSSSEEERLGAYRDAASAIIHRSDFIIAIVSRERFSSETGTSAHEAVALHVPLILIHPEQPDRFRLVLKGKDLPEQDDQSAALATCVRQLFPVFSKDEEENRGRLAEFVSEPIHCAKLPAGNDPQAEKRLLEISDFEFSGPCSASTIAPFWIKPFSGLNALCRAVLRKLLQHGKHVELPKIPRAAVTSLKFDPETARNFAELYLHYHRADQAANAYAELQRSAYVLQAILAAAVGILSAGDLVYSGSHPEFSVIILILLSCIGAIVVVAERGHWQDRWVDYRLLAEVLRAGKALLVAGKGSPLASTRDGIIALNTNHWVSCHATNILRALKIAVPGRTQEPDPHALDKAHGYINSSYIWGQIKYHAVTAAYERKLGKALKTASLCIAMLIIALAVANAVQKYFPISAYFRVFSPDGKSLDKTASDLLSVLLIILPALAAVLVSLRGYNQYEIVSRRSDAMAARLAGHLELDRPFESFRVLGEHVLSAAHMILRDVEGWMDIFVTKRME